ncbi:MAG: ATP phosphoribosyltransferase regulatory subunit, partial [Candidatus Levybacteria bacterium]|nr:ATP phosphoribosyltransferase regulatory subunit [Candidatus Levybacteria bacterium]
KVALRYDQTVPACRVVGQYANQLPTPFKRYQIQPAFRAENTQRGRYREFLQCDADIWGVESADADAEVIALSLAIYKELGFKKAIVKINDRKLLKDYPYEAIVAIDKLKKIGKEGVIEDMIQKGIAGEKAKEYLERITTLQPNDTIKTILETLSVLGFEKEWYEFDPTIARSFAYSDGPIWEVVIPEYTVGSVLGGERYDTLTQKITGRDIVGTGFAVGFDRTFEAMEELNLFPAGKTVTKVLVTVFSGELKKDSLKIASQLREGNINTELYPDSSAKMEKQLKYADQKGIPFVVIIGPEEKENNLVTLRNMKTREQKLVSITDLRSLL